MNFKAIFAASAMMAFAGAFALVGCGGDDCTKAVDHLSSCLSVSATSSSSTSTTCDGLYQCVSQATNNASCAELKDAYSGMPTSASSSYLKAVAACATSGSSSM